MPQGTAFDKGDQQEGTALDKGDQQEGFAKETEKALAKQEAKK